MRTIAFAGLFFLTLSAGAQVLTPRPYDGQRGPYYGNDPYYRDDPYSRDDRPNYGNRDRRRGDTYGYGRDPLNVASRVMSDVRMVAANNYRIDSHDRKHFDKVQQKLSEFANKYRDGNFDRGKLNDVADNLQHLVQAQSIRSARDRRVLQNALSEIDALRSGASANGYRPYNNRGPYWD